MKSSLLLWDRLHTIIPTSNYRPDYDKKRDMAEAWEMIGKGVVPDTVEQTLAHRSIQAMLQQKMAPQFKWLAAEDGRNRTRRPYEIWPQKFSPDTWQLLKQHHLTSAPLANGDYPFTPDGGVLVMAKLADAIGGDALARVTDRRLAFGLTPDPTPTTSSEDAVLMTLDLIEPTRIPLQKLIEFRKRELTERRGDDYTMMRHRYADAIKAHVDELNRLPTPRLREAKNSDFKEDMRRDLAGLKEALTGNRIELIFKPVLVATVVGAGVAAAGASGPGALLAAGSAAFGSTVTDVAEKISKLFEAGFGFSRKQKEAMAKHPMAYMYQLSRA